MRNTLHYITRFRIIIAVMSLLGVSSSCEEFLKVDAPKTETISATVYSDDLTATAAIRGIYHEMVSGGFASGNFASVSLFAGASADEFIAFDASLFDFQRNELTPSNAIVVNEIWTAAYRFIYYTNSVIEGVTASAKLTPSVSKQLEGEAKFLRAFCYFYLVNLFGDVPLITVTDYRPNASASRTPVAKVYTQMISDLTQAQQLLAADYSLFGDERIRVNASAATALLARIYLYQGEWAKAETAASQVISNNALYELKSDLNEVFLSNSAESIWQLANVTPGVNTNEAVYMIPPDGAAPAFISLSDQLIGAFEENDLRLSNWTGSVAIEDITYYYPYKYKVWIPGEPVSEYSTVLRLAEQYLIRSEARAQQGNLAGAVEDLDVIRNRAGLPAIQQTIPSMTQQDLLVAINKERQIELFSEWGHRWLDLKRTNAASDILAPLKQAWQSTDVLYPLPATELINDPQLQPQNPGY